MQTAINNDIKVPTTKSLIALKKVNCFLQRFIAKYENGGLSLIRTNIGAFMRCGHLPLCYESFVDCQQFFN
jgi:hypothetical protein